MLIPTLPASDSNNPARQSGSPGNRILKTFVSVLAGLAVFSSPPAPAETGDTPAPEPPPRVIATYYPLYLMALNVMDGLEPAPTLLLEPAGGCAHGLSLRPSQVATLGRADLIVETGLGLEPFLESSRLPWRGDVVRIPVARDIDEADLVPLLEAHDHGSHRGDAHETGHEDHGHNEHGHGEHGHEHHDPAAASPAPEVREGFNGHAWSSPRLAARMTRTLGDALARHDPARADLYRRNAARYAGQLDRLADELEAAAEPLRGARVALSHTSLAYLARELELEVVAVLRDEDENEPGPRSLTRLIDHAREDGLGAVLYDPQDGARLARLFADETGCGRLLELDPVAAGPLEKTAYTRIMENNIETIRRWARETAPIARSARYTTRSREIGKDFLEATALTGAPTPSGKRPAETGPRLLSTRPPIAAALQCLRQLALIRVSPRLQFGQTPPETDAQGLGANDRMQDEVCKTGTYSESTLENCSSPLSHDECLEWEFECDGHKPIFGVRQLAAAFAKPGLPGARNPGVHTNPNRRININ